jgi:surface protein
MGEFGTIGAYNPASIDGSQISTGSYTFTPEYSSFFIDYSGANSININDTAYVPVGALSVPNLTGGVQYILEVTGDTCINAIISIADSSIANLTFTTTGVDETVNFNRLGKIDYYDEAEGDSFGPMFAQWSNSSYVSSGVNYDDSQPPHRIYTTDFEHTYSEPGTYDVSVASYNTIDIVMNQALNFTGVKNCGYLTLVQGAFKNTGLNSWTATDRPQYHGEIYESFMNTPITSINNITDWPAPRGGNTDYGLDKSSMFEGCETFNDSGIADWNVEGTLNMTKMFKGCTSFNVDISQWDVGQVANMAGMFEATNYNQDMSWNTGNVVDMSYMFEGCANFNRDISTWNVAKVADMGSMFEGAVKYSQDMNWDTGAVTNMANMFKGVTAFDGDISGWDVTKVVNMGSMFEGAVIYNQDMSWDTSVVTNMASMFSGCSKFDQDISTWKVNNVTYMDGMFRSTPFDRDLSWSPSLLSTTYMFADASLFNGAITNLAGFGLQNTQHMFNGARTFNQDISNWYTNNVSNMTGMFQDASSYNGPMSGPGVTVKWDMAQVTNIDSMFRGASSFNQELNAWNTANIRSMNSTFDDASAFNQSLNRWEVSSVTDMGNMFRNAVVYDQCMSTWDVSGVTTMASMFQNAKAFNQDISWSVRDLENTTRMFEGAIAFNSAPISGDTSGVTNMSFMFKDAYSFDHSGVIGNWDVSSVTTMEGMFQNARSFNRPLIGWENNGNNQSSVAQVTSMAGMFNGAHAFNERIDWSGFGASDVSYMFNDASNFNGEINNWHTDTCIGPLLTNVDSMFKHAPSFNQPLTDWSVSQITNMNRMFEGAKSFNQDLYNWDISNVTSMVNMFSGAVTFSGDVTGWDVTTVTDFGTNMFDTSYLALTPMFNWTVSGGISDAALLSITSDNSGDYRMFNTVNGTVDQYHLVPSDAFVTNWQLPWSAEGYVVSIPLVHDGDISVAWGDRRVNTESFYTGDVSHAYDTSISPVVAIRGDISGWNAKTGGQVGIPPGINLLEVIQCGNLRMQGQNLDPITFATGGDFEDCSAMVWSATDTPNLTGITSFTGLFQNCGSLGSPDFSAWDTSAVNKFDDTFRNCSSFNSDIGSWDTANAATMSRMFDGAKNFNQDIGSWDTANTTTMSRMFDGAQNFNQDISSWNTATVREFSYMFRNAKNFNQDLNTWNMAAADNMPGMFQGAHAFSGDVTGWDVAVCNNFDHMFERSYLVNNKPLFNWNVGDEQVFGPYAISGITQDLSHGYQRVEAYPYSGFGVREDEFTTRLMPVSGFATRWTPEENFISIPVLHLSDVSISWDDNTGVESFHSTAIINHTYTDGLTRDRTILIRGDISGWNALTGGVAGVPPGDKLRVVAQCGTDLKFANQSGAFANCTRMVWSAIDPPVAHNLTNLSYAFYNCTSLVNPDISNWDMSGITTVASMFENCVSLTGRGGIAWGTPAEAPWHYGAGISGKMISMNSMFKNAGDFRPGLRDSGPYAFDDISWNTVNVEDMTSVFEGCAQFEALGHGGSGGLRWDFTNVTSTNSMFKDTLYDDEAASDWSVGNVKDVRSMFQDDIYFNQDLYKWDVAKVTSMNSMFSGDTNFQGDVNGWDVRTCTDFTNMFTNIDFFDPDSQDKILFNWSIGNDSDDTLMQILGDPPDNATPTIGDYRMLDEGTGYYRLVTQNAFVSRWETSFNTGIGNYVTIPNTAETSDISISWGDRSQIEGFNPADGFSLMQHQYATAGEYTIAIAGTLNGWNTHPDIVSNKAPRDKLKRVMQFGNVLTLANQKGAFADCSHMAWGATDLPDLSGVSTFESTFSTCLSLGSPNLNGWDTSFVTSMASCFESSNFDGCINLWDTRDVITFDNMFKDTSLFNQDISSWNLSSLGYTQYMFQNANAFNQDLYTWDVSGVSDFTGMFAGATTFSGDVTGWNVITATAFDGMFSTAYMASLPILNWTMFGGTNELEAITGIQSTNYTTISADDYSKIAESRTRIFPFNCFVTKWEPFGTGIVNNVTIPVLDRCDVSIAWGIPGLKLETFQDADISHTYIDNDDRTIVIRGDISGWNADTGGIHGVRPTDKLLEVIQLGTLGITNVVLADIPGAFKDCTDMSWSATDHLIFNKSVTLEEAFMNCTSLGSPNFNTWDVSFVTDTQSMFRNCTSFNTDISQWKVHNVTSMNSMFKNATSFNQPLLDWSVHDVVDMCAMFESAVIFDQDLYSWDVASVNNMSRMFLNDLSFRGDLTGWDTTAVTSYAGMLDCNYLLDLYPTFAWSVCGSDEEITQFKAEITHGHLAYSMFVTDAALPAHRLLVPSDSFVTTWEPSANSVRYGGVVVIPVDDKSDVSISWGDGTALQGYNDSDISHDYQGGYTDGSLFNIVMRGDISGWNVTSHAVHPTDHLKSVLNCGTLRFDNQSGVFADCSSLTWSATDGPRMDSIHTLEAGFANCISLGTLNLNAWDVSNVTNTDTMFQDCTNFNASMGSWTTLSLNTMDSMFRNSAFDDDIGSWNTSKVTDMGGVFAGTPFNQDIRNWDVVNALDMSGMFMDTLLFNRDIYRWNTANVTNMTNMFSGAISFYGDTTGWDARSVTDFDGIFDNSYSDTLNRGPPLFNWVVDENYKATARINITQDQSSNYILVQDPLITNLYRLIPAGSFLSEWATTDRPCHNVTLPINAASDISIDWGGSHESPTESFHNTMDICHNYDENNTNKVVLIKGNLRGWNAKTSTHPAGIALKRMLHCGGISGTLQPENSASAFADCTQMIWNATDTPNIHGVTTLETWFENCVSMGSVGQLNWDTSAITTLSGTFMGATTFDCSIDNWDTSNVTTMTNTFRDASYFTQDISGWDVSNVTNMDGMFYGASLFNHPLNDWSVHNVSNLDNIFREAYTFDQNLSDWSMVNVNTLNGTFQDAIEFNQNLENWDVGAVTSMASTFNGATLFVSDISVWNVDNVVDMQSMFKDAVLFNSDLSWNVDNVTDMASMFSGAVAFRGNIDEWDTSACRDFTNFGLPQLFFNHDQTDPPQFSYYNSSAGLTTWNVSAATNPGDVLINDASGNYMYDISSGIITYQRQLMPGMNIGTSVELSTAYPHVRIPIRPLAANHRISLVTPSGHHYKYDLQDDAGNTILTSTELMNINDSCLSTLTRDLSYSLMLRLQSKQTTPVAQLTVNQQTYDNSITIAGINNVLSYENSAGAVDTTYYYTVSATQPNQFFKVSISATSDFDNCFYDFTVYHDNSYVSTHTDAIDTSLVEISDSIPVITGIYTVRIYAESPGMRGTTYKLRIIGINPSDSIPGEAITKYLRDAASKITIMTRRSTAYPH